MSRWSSPLAPALVLVAHGVALWGLAQVDVVGELLGAARPNPLWLLVAVLFYQLRLLAVFVAPGWLLLSVVGWARRRRARSSPR